MKRALWLVFLIVFFGAAPSWAEFREIDITTFGMD